MFSNPNRDFFKELAQQKESMPETPVVEVPPQEPVTEVPPQEPQKEPVAEIPVQPEPETELARLAKRVLHIEEFLLQHAFVPYISDEEIKAL